MYTRSYGKFQAPQSNNDILIKKTAAIAKAPAAATPGLLPNMATAAAARANATPP
jgi:hypothetical protein